MDITSVIPFQSKLVSAVRKEGIFTASKTFTKWTQSNSGFNNLATFSMTSSDLVVVATEAGVFVSRDLAANYSRGNKGLTDSLHVNDLSIAGSWIIAATQNGGVFYSADTARNWTSINSGLHSMNIKKVFFGNGMKWAITEDGQLYSSLIAAIDWSLSQYDLPTGTIVSSLTVFGDNILLSTS